MSWQPADHADRERARRSRGETLVLEAGAGTGKTTLLVDRIESLILDGHARVTEIATDDVEAREQPDRERMNRRAEDLVERRRHAEAAAARAAGAGAGTRGP